MQNDGGFLSRKLLLAIFGMSLLTAVAFATCKFSFLSGVYSSLCGAVVSLFALYVGANSAVKYIYSKGSPENKPLIDKKGLKQPIEQRSE